MKRILLFLLLGISAALTVTGQGAMNFQALARETSGKLLTHQPVQVRISFSSKDAPAAQMHYAELHQVQTDGLGLFNVQVGAGAPQAGLFGDIPWSEKQIWMDVEIQAGTGSRFELLQSTQLRAVPYALHAQQANRLTESGAELELEKNQNVRWNTTGNSLTSPETQFIGTRDARDLVIKTNGVTRAIISKDGQISFKAGAVARGPDFLESSYPWVIQGSRQGINIKVNGSRNVSNNFVAFGDPEEFQWGAIEGQTWDDFTSTWQYRIPTAVRALTAASLAAQITGFVTEAAGLGVACGCAAASLIFAWAAPGFCTAAAATVAQGVTLGTQAGALAYNLLVRSQNLRSSRGVTYASGRADYAEYLERDTAVRDLQFGEIVGVKGGKVSLNTEDADHILAISSGPIFLGKAPQPDQEHLYEKVAFLGQVRVRVVGKVDVGDYILASGNNDGMGIAVNPADMEIADFARVAGVAWEYASDNPVNIVNMGIGINANDFAPQVEAIAHKLDNIEAFLEGKVPLLSALGAPVIPEFSLEDLLDPNREYPVLFTDEEFDQLIDARAAQIRKYYTESNAELQSISPLWSECSDVARAYYQDPVAAMKAARRDPALQKIWGRVDFMLKNR